MSQSKKKLILYWLSLTKTRSVGNSIQKLVYKSILRLKISMFWCSYYPSIAFTAFVLTVSFKESAVLMAKSKKLGIAKLSYQQICLFWEEVWFLSDLKSATLSTFSVIKLRKWSRSSISLLTILMLIKFLMNSWSYNFSTILFFIVLSYRHKNNLKS